MHNKLTLPGQGSRTQPSRHLPHPPHHMPLRCADLPGAPMTGQEVPPPRSRVLEVHKPHSSSLLHCWMNEPQMGSGQGSPACLLLSGQVSGVSGPRGVLSAVCGAGGAPALKFLFCEQSLLLLPSFPRVSPQPYLPLPSLLFSHKDAQTPSSSDMPPLLLPLLWAGEWTVGQGWVGRGLG